MCSGPREQQGQRPERVVHWVLRERGNSRQCEQVRSGEGGAVGLGRPLSGLCPLCCRGCVKQEQWSRLTFQKGFLPPVGQLGGGGWAWTRGVAMMRGSGFRMCLEVGLTGLGTGFYGGRRNRVSSLGRW